MLPSQNSEILRLEKLQTGYGNREVIQDVSLEVKIGEIVALIGHNGAGKTTVLKTIYGMLPAWKGSIFVGGKKLYQPSPRILQRQGVVYILQGKRVFPDLTVLENLEVITTVLRRNGIETRSVDEAFRHIPNLRNRQSDLASALSGGEKQMLALSSLVISKPRLVLLDEPSLGLAPKASLLALENIVNLIRQIGGSALIVEQKVQDVLRIADRVYVLKSGKIEFSGLAKSISDLETLRRIYL